jgi:hypothetical protein
MSMASDCERFEVEIGMRQHGALEPKEELALTAHLAGCPSCQEFAASGADMLAALERQAKVEAAQVDWDDLQRRVRRLERSYRRKLWLAPLFILQIPLVFLLGLGQLPPRELLAASPVTVAIYLAYVWLVNRPFREVMAVVRGGDGLLLGYARELRRQRLRARVFVVANLSLALVSIIEAVVEPGLRLRLYAVGCVFLFAGWAIYDLRVRLPRIERALAELGR